MTADLGHPVMPLLAFCVSPLDTIYFSPLYLLEESIQSGIVLGSSPCAVLLMIHFKAKMHPSLPVHFLLLLFMDIYSHCKTHSTSLYTSSYTTGMVRAPACIYMARSQAMPIYDLTKYATSFFNLCLENQKQLWATLQGTLQLSVYTTPTHSSGWKTIPFL